MYGVETHGPCVSTWDARKPQRKRRNVRCRDARSVRLYVGWDAIGCEKLFSTDKSEEFSGINVYFSPHTKNARP